MFRIDCPWCGPRDQHEFTCGGEAHIVRPHDPASLSDSDWARYLFMRTNPLGVHHERWSHSHGCRRWFHIARNTATDRIIAVYRIDETAPPLVITEPVPDTAAVTTTLAAEEAPVDAIVSTGGSSG